MGPGKFYLALSGPEGIRTPDLFSAIEARSQLRYRPGFQSARYSTLGRGGCQAGLLVGLLVLLVITHKSENRSFCRFALSFCLQNCLCQGYTLPEYGGEKDTGNHQGS
jgi:hypothetical protein